jgi:hypothetical protein
MVIGVDDANLATARLSLRSIGTGVTSDEVPTA